MSKSIYVEVSYDGPVNEPYALIASEELTYQGYDLIQFKYSAAPNFYSVGNNIWTADQFSVAGASSSTPSDLLTAHVGPAGDTWQKWDVISVPDAFTIPWQQDLTGTVGGFHYGSAAETSITAGPLSFNLSSATFSSESIGQLATDAAASAPAILENAFNGLGFSGLGTAVHNVSAATQAVGSITGSGLTLFSTEMAAFSNPSVDPATIDAAVNAYLAGASARAGQAFDSATLIPGNSGADAAAHGLIRAIGLVGDGSVPVNGSASVDIQFVMPGGLVLTTSATASFGFVLGGDGGATLRGLSTTNELIGGAGNDTIYAGAGSDYVNAGAGNDTIIAGTGSAFIDGGAGADTVRFTGVAGVASVVIDGSGDLHIVSGAQQTTTVAVEQLQFSDTSAGTSHAAEVIDDYLSLMGRAPTAAELGIWDAARSGSTTSVAMAAAIAQASSDAALSTFIADSYEDFFGRAPLASETAVWTTMLRNGTATPASFTIVLAGVAQNQGSLSTLIGADYQSFLGRAPTAAEIGVWTTALTTGASDDRAMQLVLAAQPGGAAHAVQQLYDDYFGRDPTTAETSYWVPRLAGGAASEAQVRAVLLADLSGIQHSDTIIAGLYQTYFGRAASDTELGVWRSQLAAGATFDDVRTALVTDPSGQIHTSVVINSLYQTDFGRAATPAELGVWQGAVRSGSGFDMIDAVLKADAGSLASKGKIIVADYDAYFGRDPMTAEVTVWQHLMSSANDSAALRAALVTAPEGIAHIDSIVAGTYADYVGRAPTAMETAADLLQVQQGATLGQLRQTILSSPDATMHVSTIVAADYASYLTRAPTAAEANYWLNHIVTGGTTGDLVTALDALPESHILTVGPTVTRSVLSNAGEDLTVTLQAGQRYQFAVASNGTHGLVSPNVDFLGPTGQLLTDSFANGATNVSFGYTAAATGKYMLHVWTPYPGTGDFTVGVSQPTGGLFHSIAHDPGSTPATAEYLGDLVTGLPYGFHETLPVGDTDYYHFHIATAAQIDLRLTAATDQVGVNLRTGDGLQLAFAEGTGTFDLIDSISAGDYYLQIFSLTPQGHTDYSASFYV